MPYFFWSVIVCTIASILTYFCPVQNICIIKGFLCNFQCDIPNLLKKTVNEKKWKKIIHLPDLFKIGVDVQRTVWRKMLDQAYFSSLLYVLIVNRFVSFLCNLIKMWPQWGMFFENCLKWMKIKKQPDNLSSAHHLEFILKVV